MFEQYKDIHKDKPAYLLGTGPTVESFPADDYPGIYVGVNEAHLLPIKLDYLLTEKQHPNLKNLPDALPVFYSGVELDKPNCFEYRYHLTEWGPFQGTNDEIISRFYGVSSMIYHGFFLALHLGCKKIHLVGCDCTGKWGYTSQIKGWKYIKEYVAENNPDVEIININPMNLKDVFPSIYTA